MKTIDGPSKIKLLSLMFLSFLMIGSCIIYHNYITFSSIEVVVKKNAAVEYGSANYDINDFIKKVEGEIVSIKNDIDTNEVGDHEVVVTVKKENILKDVPVMISVIDTSEPVIEIKSDKMTVTRGDQINFLENIVSVKDGVDGDISYLDTVEETSNFYYHFDYDPNTIGDVGEHEVSVVAKDKNGITSQKSFKLEVLAPKIITYTPRVYHNLPANPVGGNVVSIAYSLLGSPYVSGGNSPSGFDCSGFVQYVYSLTGTSISRSSSTQIHDGLGVPYEEAQPGDILSWGNGSSPSHSALYVGNGQMIHASNPRQGVIISDVAGWTRGSGTHVISVRRIQ